MVKMDVLPNDGDGTAVVDLDTGVDVGHPDFDYPELDWEKSSTLQNERCLDRNPKLRYILWTRNMSV